jgi:hypothetical protein
MLLVFAACAQTARADTDEQKRSLIRAYVNLRIKGCDAATLQAFATALTGISDSEAFAIGLTDLPPLNEARNNVKKAALFGSGKEQVWQSSDTQRSR